MVNWTQLLLQATTSTTAWPTPAVEDAAGQAVVGSYFGPVKEGVVKSTSLNFVEVSYPLNGGQPALSSTPMLSKSILVGLHLQVLEGTLSDEDCNQRLGDDTWSMILGLRTSLRAAGRPLGDKPPGLVVFETSKLLAAATYDFGLQDSLVAYQKSLKDKADIPDGVLVEGTAYTARVRAVLAYPYALGDGIDPTWFVFQGVARPYYTRWGTARFKVNKKPSVVSLMLNGFASPPKIPSTAAVNFGFTIKNEDGPDAKYKIQVGGVHGGSFSPTAWDSGWVVLDNGTGNVDVSAPYQGSPLSKGATYAWRARANDGLADGDWSDAKYFTINQPPVATSLQVDSQEILFGDTPRAKAAAPTVSWTYVGSPQKTYSLFYRQEDWLAEEEVSGKGATASVVLPTVSGTTFDSGKNVFLRLVVSDGIESAEFSGQFVSSKAPTISSISIDGDSNPTDVANLTPTISWVYQSQDGGAQQRYQVRVSTAIDFSAIIWDPGAVTSAADSVVYAGPALSHGTYFVRVIGYDGISWSDWAASPPCFFSFNHKPNAPTLILPVVGTYSGTLEVRWIPAAPLDADGDAVTYALEVTSTRSSNRGWKFLVGPLPSYQTSYVIGASDLPAGDDYGVRIVASDSMSSADPSTSQRFAIANHAPTTPVFYLPSSGQVVSNFARVEWIEANPPDVDGDLVYYVLEAAPDSSTAQPTWSLVATLKAGTNSYVLDASALDDGTDYRLRITAIDEKGKAGSQNLSPKFAVDHTVVVNDVETFRGSAFASTSDGRLVKYHDAYWQFGDPWLTEIPILGMSTFFTPGAKVSVSGQEVIISDPAGETFLFREGS
jgi:hypothetical protein